MLTNTKIWSYWLDLILYDYSNIVYISFISSFYYPPVFNYSLTYFTHIYIQSQSNKGLGFGTDNMTGTVLGINP